MNHRIKELEAEIRLEQIKMNNCVHTFQKAFYNPETVKEGYGSVQDGAGSDPHWSFAGYIDKQVPRWTRVCSKCGKEEHTNKQRPVTSRVDYEPDFKD